MITFFCALILLIVGYMVYGRIIENVLKPDDRETPAIAKADGVDYVEMKPAKIFLIQLLNIAGLGPISGFHATQSPMMARCLPSEKYGRKIFYGAMVAEGFGTWIGAGIAYPVGILFAAACFGLFLWKLRKDDGDRLVSLAAAK